ncbi:MAG: hypothetical protein K0R00_127 [Herbinix sp.]|nr:hypothetical protein [Herbinix sp.]
MAHAILSKNERYSVDITVENVGRIEDGKYKEDDNQNSVIKYKKEYEKDDILKMAKDLKNSELHGELIVYEISRAYSIVDEVYKNKDTKQEEHYKALRLVPSYEKIDKYKF